MLNVKSTVANGPAPAHLLGQELSMGSSKIPNCRRSLPAWDIRRDRGNVKPHAPEKTSNCITVHPAVEEAVS
jgi:hypothetical protein